jgi:hypothetical protein
VHISGGRSEVEGRLEGGAPRLRGLGTEPSTAANATLEQMSMDWPPVTKRGLVSQNHAGRSVAGGWLRDVCDRTVPDCNTSRSRSAEEASEYARRKRSISLKLYSEHGARLSDRKIAECPDLVNATSHGNS